MKFPGGFSVVSLCIIVLSIYVALYGIEFDNGMLRFTKDSSENVTNGLFSIRSPLNKDDSEEITPCTSLRHDFYRTACPSAERIIRTKFLKIYKEKPSIAPSLIRLLFHDCFIGGCDASVLLDADEGFKSEKEAIPNLSLKGLYVIDAIKLELENVCPGIVSCADIVVLAAREATTVTGGPYYLLKTGRKDSLSAFKEAANQELPSPQASLSVILTSFSLKNFTLREVVSLSGAHSVGVTNCTFFEDRIYNFSGSGKPDPVLNKVFLKELKSKCPMSASASSRSPSAGTGVLASEYSKKSYNVSSENRSDRVVDMSFNNEGGQDDFGIRYYRRLLHHKGVMVSDQQLTSIEESKKWVRLYAADKKKFRRDFAKAMTKLSNLKVLTGTLGEVRTTCSRVLGRS